MSDIHLVTSPRCGQKCLVSVERFKAMQCRLGGLVRAVDGDTGRTLICEVWPRQVKWTLNLRLTFIGFASPDKVLF